jgi:hypothetical protein
MRLTRSLKLFTIGCVALFARCGGQLEPAEVEDLGPYADRVMWAEYMATAAMDTVGGVASSGACSTAPVRGLSDQIVAEMNCIKPGLMTRIDGYNVTLTSSAALPYLQAPAAASLKAATTWRSGLHLNSALRSVAQQWLLYHWYQSHQCGIALAAKPGLSNHEDGMALDTPDYSSWRSTLEANGFHWFGSSDVVHFDRSGGVDARGVLAFPRLWNRNNPRDRITEDGIFGPQVDARIKMSPRAGFSGPQSCS